MNVLVKSFFTILFTLCLLSIDHTCAAGEMKIYIIDVNNKTWVNEAILIVSPAGKTMLIDAGFESGYKPDGSEADYGKNPVKTFLEKKGIKKLDWVMLTHPHDDHIGGLKELIADADIKIGEILYSDVPTENIIRAEPGKSAGEYYTSLVCDIRKLCAAQKIKMTVVNEGEKINMGGGAELKIIATAMPKIETKNYINNNSIVAMLSYKNFSMLFTGDAGLEEEKRIMQKNPDLKCDILKAGHHAGAEANSEEWLRFTKPLAAVASAPEWLFGDPRGKEGYQRFQNNHILVFYTWQNGTIEINSNGKDTKITSFCDGKVLYRFSK